MDYPSNGTGNEKQHNITRGQMDKMTTAELLQLLEQINEEITEDNFDDDLITACLDALDQKSPMPEHPSTEESWQSFKEKVGAEYFCPESSRGGCGSRPKRKTKRIFRTGLIVAIVAASLFSCMIVAQAAGIDVFGSIARWTEDVLGFGDRDLEAQETQTALSAEDVTRITDQIESWRLSIDSDYEVSEPEVVTDEKSGILYYSVLYNNDYNRIAFEAKYQQTDLPYSLFEKDGNKVDQMVLKEVSVYLYKNIDTAVATWRIDNTEFNVITDLSLRELKQILEDSFGGTMK